MKPNGSARQFGRKPRYPRSSGFPWGGLAIIVLVFALIVGGVTWEVVKNTHTEHVTFTVSDKAVKTDCHHDSGSCKSIYLIYTDKGTFKDTDSLWFFKWNSSDVYGELKRGKTYSCKVAGYRVHFTSSYQNLISCEAV